MIAAQSNRLPHGVPCAQCNEPIPAPEWTESGSHCVHFLWHCEACGYRFEAVAFYAGSQAIPDSIAA